MRRLVRNPYLWFAAFALWFGTLWWLSSRVNQFPAGLDFRFSDKLLHFGWFFGGALIFSAFLYRFDPLEPTSPRWKRSMALTVLVVGLTGALDEWHQSFVPGRSGNDPADFAADLAGAFAGALVFRWTHRLIA